MENHGNKGYDIHGWAMFFEGFMFSKISNTTILISLQFSEKFSVRFGGIPCIKTGATLYHAQLGPLSKGRAIKELVVYWV